MKKLNDLNCQFIDEKSQDFDWSEGYGETWEYYEAGICSECGKAVMSQGGEEQHRHIENTECEGYVNCEGPMMNYYYPFETDDPEEAAKKIKDLPLCLVYFLEAEKYGLALTGGGMNLSWEICEAYMLLGCLPPVAFCSLPQMAGKKLSAKNRWILGGCRKSLLCEKRTALHGLEKLKNLRKNMREA